MQHLILKPDNFDSALQTAAAVLAAGGLVIYPTETVYGAGVDATNPAAVTRLLRFKNRPAGRAISLLVADQTSAEALVELNSSARQLYASFLPGPMTVISKSRGQVDQRLESEVGTLGIRISSHSVASGLAQLVAKPITATSANASGKARPYTVATCLAGLSANQAAQIDLILDAGTLPPNEPSTVVDTTKAVQELVRAGSQFEEYQPPIVTESAKATIMAARQLAEASLHVLPYRSLVFAVSGPLGAGKTQFAKGVAEALGIQEPITSPSYTLMKEYQGKGGRLIHIDLWRTPEITAEQLGLEEYLQSGTILVIEWAQPIMLFLEQHSEVLTYQLDITPESETVRTITIQTLC